MNPARHTHKTILVLLSKGYTPQFESIIRFGRIHNWKIIPINIVCFDNTIYHAETKKPLKLETLSKTWNVDGIIADTVASKFVHAHKDALNIPIVFPDQRPEDLGLGAKCVQSDDRAVATAAAHELFSLGYSHYAFVPNGPIEASWSRERSSFFQRIVLQAGCIFHHFTFPTLNKSVSAELRAWLRKLPTPCGIFCATDYIASDVRDECLKTNLRIPEDIGLIGVDNLVEICETNSPTISSIEQDLLECYYMASQVLDEMIDNPQHIPATKYFGVMRTVRRASTSALITVDSRIKRALEYIRLHASERITPIDVVKTMGYSRTYADLRFRKCTGHSIVHEISLRRIELVKQALHNPETRVKDLAESTGFASDVDMRRVFKKITGLTPREWRNYNSKNMS